MREQRRHSGARTLKRLMKICGGGDEGVEVLIAGTRRWRRHVCLTKEGGRMGRDRGEEGEHRGNRGVVDQQARIAHTCVAQAGGRARESSLIAQGGHAIKINFEPFCYQMLKSKQGVLINVQI